MESVTTGEKYFSKTRAGEGGKAQEGSELLDSKAWQLETV